MLKEEIVAQAHGHEEGELADVYTFGVIRVCALGRPAKCILFVWFGLEEYELEGLESRSCVLDSET